MGHSSRAIGMMVYVFNCSEQMDYKSCGNIFKGLAQTGGHSCAHSSKGPGDVLMSSIESLWRFYQLLLFRLDD